MQKILPCTLVIDLAEGFRRMVLLTEKDQHQKRQYVGKQHHKILISTWHAQYFHDLMTLSSVTGMRKPAPDIFTVALCQLQSAPEECVYVGDTISRDIIGSKRAGFAKAIQICSKLTREKDCGVKREFEPDYMVEDIYQVYPILRELLGA